MALQFSSPIPLALYVHLPWCVRKCPYCDFNSHALRQALPEEAYVAALLRDLDQDLPAIWGRRLVSIFLGGGTPSLFSPEAIAQLLRGIRARIPFGPEIEITLEANPGTVERARFKGFLDAGVNRLSIGVQSLQDDKLQALGRIHTADAAIQAIIAAREVGFKTFNVDLMFGLPGQVVEDALYDLATALAHEPPHLSWYQLTLEANTWFERYPPLLPTDEVIDTIQTQGQALLAAHGLRQYEVSAYAKPRHHSQHNMNYWAFGDYLGIGAGAHSKLTDYQQGVVKRCWKVKHPKKYLKASCFIAEGQSVSEQALPFEFMLNALRLYQSIPLSLFESRTGLSSAVLQPTLSNLEQSGMLIQTDSSFELTALGHRFLNDVLLAFMP